MSVSQRPLTPQLASGLTFDPDPVLALRAWTAATWPGQVLTDPLTWEPSLATPGVYWRIQRSEEFQRLTWGSWLDLTIRGHVLHPDPDVRVTWCRRVFEALLLTGSMLGGPVALRVREPSVDMDLDPLRVGQIALTGRMALPRPGETAELLRHAYGNAVGGGHVEVHRP